MPGSHPPNIYLLANPASGRGRGTAALAQAESLLRARGILPTVLRTSGPLDAIRLSREAVEAGAELLIVSGGDGTLRDAVEGLLTASHGQGTTAVGILPSGTGNDLTRTLGIPRRLPEALEVALTGRDYPLDVWRWDERPFVNIAGVGLDAAVASAVNRKFRTLRGPLAYVAGALHTLPRFRPFPLELRFAEGGWSGQAWLAAFANARCYGGGMQIAPGAVPDDGLLDIVLVEETSRSELLRQLPGLFSGKHVSHPAVKLFRTEAVEILAPPQDVTLDGELLGATPGHVTRAGSRIRMRVPRTQSS